MSQARLLPKLRPMRASIPRVKLCPDEFDELFRQRDLRWIVSSMSPTVSIGVSVLSVMGSRNRDAGLELSNESIFLAQANYIALNVIQNKSKLLLVLLADSSSNCWTETLRRETP